MKKLLASALGITLCAFTGTAMADEPPASCQPKQTSAIDCGCGDNDLSLAIGERVWFSFARSFWNINGPGGLPRPALQFKYHELYSTVFETNFDIVADNRFVAHFDIGAGGIDHGKFLLSAAAEPSTALAPAFSGDVNNDNLFYVNADFGYRLLSTGGNDCCGGAKLTVDALIGYQYWRERYVASDLSLLVRTGVPIPGGPAIDELWKRDNLRVGVRAAADIGCRTSINTRLMFVPWAEHQVEEKILIATPPVNFSNRSFGGFGVMWDGAASYRITSNLSAEIGYQVWFEEIDHGKNVNVNGTATPLQSGELSTVRHGAIIGLNYRF